MTDLAIRFNEKREGFRFHLSAITLLVFMSIPLSFASTNSGFSSGTVVADENDSKTTRFFKEHFGVSYNSFFSGPGFGPNNPIGTPPGLAGAASDTGLNFLNIISAKYKLGNGFAIDVQFRNQLVVTNSFEYRHQGQRFGISGKLLGGDDWSIAGAINTDIPITPIMGQLASQRTLLLSPGFFGSFNWEPKDSRWSVFALLAPRMWIYTDRNAIAVQDSLQGGIMNKPEFDFVINPSINYKISETVGWRLGATFEFLKNIGWDNIRRTYMPIETGVTWDYSKQFGLYAYLTASTPLDDSIRSYQLNTTQPASWVSTASVNLWLYGTLF